MGHYDNIPKPKEGDVVSATTIQRLIDREPVGGGDDAFVDATGTHPHPRIPPAPEIRAFEIKAGLDGKDGMEPGERCEVYLLEWDSTTGDYADGDFYEGGYTTTGAYVVYAYDETHNNWGFPGERGWAVRKPGGADYGTWVVLVNPGQPWYWGKINGRLTAGSSAEASVWRGEDASAPSDTTFDITVYDWLLAAASYISTDDKVRIGMEPHSGRWYVIGAACE